MNSRDRRIRRLRFACEREEHALRGRTLLADALQTASLGDEGRVVVIRSLALGRLSPYASAMEWSLRLEQRVRVARARAVFAEAAAAEKGDAVWFPNEIELWVSLAVRASRGAPCGEWFWPLAAAGWNPRLSLSETLRLTFRRVASTGGLPATFVLARRLARESGLLPLLRALSTDDVLAVLPSPYEPAPLPAGEAAAANHAPQPTSGPACPSAWLPAVTEFLSGVSPDDARLVWLAAAALFSEINVPPSTGEMLQLTRRAIQRWSFTLARRGKSEAPPAPALADPAQIMSSLPEGEKRLLESATPEAPRDPQGKITACGGLFFLVPLFARLGISEMTGAGKAAWMALRLVLERCQRSPQDNLNSALCHTEEYLPKSFVLPRLLEVAHGPLKLARWQRQGRVLLDATGRLPLAAWLRGTISPLNELIRDRAVRRAAEFPRDIEPMVLALALGAHRLCRRQSGLGLKTLVRRPARVAITDTHIDIFFRPHEIDVRIRRAALDVDPGWVPWLGRVVAFHYTRSD